MEFALGSVRKETKQQKKERMRKEKDRKRKEAQRHSHVSLPFEKKPTWLILPHSLSKEFEFWITTLEGSTFVSKRDALLKQVSRMKAPRKPILGFDLTGSEEFKKDFLHKAEKVMSLLHQNQTMRWKFKVFLTKARILRFQQLNEKDPITMETCKQPIYVHSFHHRKTYAFEAEAFAKHIHKKLTSNDGHLPTPAYPRNPLTNEPFTLSQTMSLLRQCKKAGHSSWSLEAFKACRYDMTSFIAVHSKPLRLHALHTTMASIKDWDCIDTLYDFIKSQHADHNALFSCATYKWAVNHAPSEPLVEQWRKLCIKWYEVDIVMDDPTTKGVFFTELQHRTLPLCTSPKELIALRVSFLKSHQERED